MWLLTRILDFLYDERPRNPQCAFCGRRYLDVDKLLVESPRKRCHYICDSCIDFCREIIDAEKRRRGILPPISESPVNES